MCSGTTSANGGLFRRFDKSASENQAFAILLVLVLG
jgi:hypothetical protein